MVSTIKNSDFDWIGSIPIDWKILRTKYISNNLDGKRKPLNSVDRSLIKGDIPYWGSNGIVDHINQYLFVVRYNQKSFVST